MAVGNIRNVSSIPGSVEGQGGAVSKIQTERSANYDDVLKKYKDQTEEHAADSNQKKKQKSDGKNLTQSMPQMGRRMMKSRKLTQKQLLDEIQAQQNLMRNKIKDGSTEEKPQTGNSESSAVQSQEQIRKAAIAQYNQNMY